MPKISWSSFTDRHATAHLLVAIPSIAGGTKAIDHRARLFRRQLDRLLGELALEHDHATTIARPNGHSEIHAAFEHRADADQLARIVRATTTGRYPGWASRRLFVLDEPTIAAVEAHLDGGR
jgi:hypothetical protein